MLHFINTSILDSQAQTVVNTVNTVGVMGKGLAQAYKDRYPKMFEAYKSICDRKLLDIGKLWLWRGGAQQVLNFPTKTHWRYPSKIEYVEAGLAKFVAQYEKQGIREISFPRLGCGNGGLDWADVRPLMEHHLKSLPIPVYIHDFDASVGAPEHKLAIMPASYKNSFEAVLEDLRLISEQHDGKFQTIFGQSPFTAHLQSDNSVIFTPSNGKRIIVPADDLYEAWFMLVHGPLTNTKLVGSARSASSYVLSYFASLPYARAINIRNVNATTPSVAVELSGEFVAEQVLTATS
jgi:O-acetyl-ADP-ribose deacetylase (regulator of RNase III)